MFRDRMLHWAKLLDGVTCTMNTTVILAKTRLALLFIHTAPRSVRVPRTNDPDPRLAVAVAYVQISRLNR
jgi:hypothetical protein